MGSQAVCNFCGKPAGDVENLVALGEASICNECIGFWARRMGLVGPESGRGPRDNIPLRDRLPVTFTYSLELEGHFGQKYDTFLLLCLLDIAASEHWDVAIELARITRADGFERSEVARGAARYSVDLMVRAASDVSEDALRAALEGRWQRLTEAYARLAADKGTRDLIDPRLQSLAAYVIGRAGEPGVA